MCLSDLPTKQIGRFYIFDEFFDKISEPFTRLGQQLADCYFDTNNNPLTLSCMYDMTENFINYTK